MRCISRTAAAWRAMSLGLFLVVCQVATAQDRPHIFGIGTANGGWTLLEPAGYTDAMFDAMAHAGSTSTRLGASWADMEPQQGQYIWDELDEDVARCLAHGITPYCLIVNTPAWASPTGQMEPGYPPTSAARPAFEAFCTALAARYAGQCDRWEIWNEQNGYGWHTDGGFNRVDEYAPVLRAAYHGLKAGNPNCIVAIGGLDDPDLYPGDATGWRGANFMRLLYEELADRGWDDEELFDAVADHPYQSRQPMDQLRQKLRALHNELLWNGDGDKPIWITEYGWSTKWDDVDPQEQADLFTEYLSILLEPEFSYVTMASCLAISDMETGYEGWGLTDQNLRPKPAFYAFQAYPRGSGPQISHVDWRPVDAGTIEVMWQTHLPATSQVEYGPTASYGQQTALDTVLKTEHAIQIAGLTPGGVYHLRALATATDLPATHSADYEVRCPDDTVPNGDFEQGVPGIARDWRTVGTSFCTDGQVVGRVHGGSHAQAIVTVGDWGALLDDVMYTFVAVPQGYSYTFSAFTWVETGVTGADKLARQVGTDPTGGIDPEAASVIWGTANAVEDAWAQQSVTATSENSIVTVFVRVETLQYIAGLHWLYLDDAGITFQPSFAVADFDQDDDVDIEDYGHLQTCLTADGEPQNESACLDARLDADTDVDIADVELFLSCLSGPSVILPPTCPRR